MVLSVKELSSWTQTYAYFDELAETLHKDGSGQRARPRCFRGRRRIGRGAQGLEDPFGGYFRAARNGRVAARVLVTR